MDESKRLRSFWTTHWINFEIWIFQQKTRRVIDHFTQYGTQIESITLVSEKSIMNEKSKFDV